MKTTPAARAATSAAWITLGCEGIWRFSSNASRREIQTGPLVRAEVEQLASRLGWPVVFTEYGFSLSAPDGVTVFGRYPERPRAALVGLTAEVDCAGGAGASTYHPGDAARSPEQVAADAAWDAMAPDAAGACCRPVFGADCATELRPLAEQPAFADWAVSVGLVSPTLDVAAAA